MLQLLALLGVATTALSTEFTPILYSSHSHNDYREQNPPLWHAVSLGIGSVEADLHLKDGQLYIGHDFASSTTVQQMYLDPLQEKINRDGYVWGWDSTQPLNILFDLKTSAIPTYEALYSLIATNYSSMFSCLDGDDVYRQSFVHCIVTGNHPVDFMQQEGPPHFCSIDYDVTNNTFNQLFNPIESHDFHSVFGKFTRTLDAQQLQQLQAMIVAARDRKQRLRFWNAPNTDALWGQMVESDPQRDVIVLNLDDLAKGQTFLLGAGYNNTNQGCHARPQWCVEP